jgi:hypothetical protein
MSWWHVAFAVIPAGKKAGDEEDVEMWIEAASSRDALLCAAARLMLAAGELIHDVHVSAPRATPPVPAPEDDLAALGRMRVRF